MSINKSVEVVFVDKGGFGRGQVGHFQITGGYAREIFMEKIDGVKTIVVHGAEAIESFAKGISLANAKANYEDPCAKVEEEEEETESLNGSYTAG